MLHAFFPASPAGGSQYEGLLGRLLVRHLSPLLVVHAHHRLMTTKGSASELLSPIAASHSILCFPCAHHSHHASGKSAGALPTFSIEMISRCTCVTYKSAGMAEVRSLFVGQYYVCPNVTVFLRHGTTNCWLAKAVLDAL